VAKILKTDELVNSALRRSMIPSDQVTFTSEDVQDIMNEEFGIHVLPVILRAHEEYFVTNDDVPLVSGKTKYKIPYRSIGNKLREVSYIDSNGSVYEMSRISVEDIPIYRGSYSTNRIYSFYVENDSIVLVNQTASTGSLRMTYYLRPNELVANSKGGVITNVDTTSVPGETTITMSTFPEDFPTVSTFDIVQGRSPNKIIIFDRAVSSVDSTAQTITFSTDSDVDSDLVVGDIISKAEESIVPQMPTELQPILVQRVAVKMLEALGDTEGMNNAQKELERMEYNAMSLIDSRVEGSPEKITNRHSTLTSAVISNRRNRRNY